MNVSSRFGLNLFVCRIYLIVLYFFCLCHLVFMLSVWLLSILWLLFFVLGGSLSLWK
jgi:hypothetical protein